MNLSKYIRKNFCCKVSWSSYISLIGWFVGMMFLFSCSEDIDVRNAIEEIPDGSLQINFAIPDPVAVETRADGIDESAINSLHIFIYADDQNNTFLQHQEINLSSLNNYQVSVPLNNQARDRQTYIYAVANLNLNDELITDFHSLTVLKNHILDSMDAQTYIIDLGNGVPMIGFGNVNTASETIATISLLRDLAKITTNVTAENYTLEEYKIYNFAPNAYLGSAVDSDLEFYKDDRVNDGLTITRDKDFTEYLYPTKGMSEKGDNDGSFIVVKVKKSVNVNGTVSSEDHFYRLNLRIGDEVKDGILTYVDFQPNHWYKINISGFLTDGYDSYEEAMKHPETDQYVAYEIHDHAAEVLSMITDGYNELGVSPEVKLSPRQIDASGKITGRDGIIVVKCYSPDKTVDINDFKIDLNGNDDWLTLGESKKHEINDADLEYDHDNKGQQFEVPVSIVSTKNVYEDTSWEIKVKWNDLERTVIISYEAAFLLPQVCEAKLIIKNGDENLKEYASIKDYWTFITGAGTVKNNKVGSVSGEDNTPKLWGILAGNMTNGKKRTGGFHFPMPYGNDHASSPWEYEYEVDFSKMLELPEYSGKTISEVTHTVEGDDFFKGNNLSWTYKLSDKKGVLKLVNNKTSYQYAGGEITFNLAFSDGTSAQVTASLYHTGFFHYENSSEYAPADLFGYYYYEVVPMGDGYWLDRNIGAYANTSFIDIGNDLTDDERAAAGRQFSIIKQTKSFQLADFNLEMCPPGYHIPTQTEWDNLRLDPNFKTRSTTMDHTVYMSTYYETGNAKIGNVYLQKARFYYGVDAYNDRSQRYSVVPNVGDAGAGYYWSMTEAPAMEKEQMGNWVRALYLNGSASTYVNASLTDHRMPIRCKAGNENEAKKEQEKYISFNVHNATHAFIFNKDNHSALYAFPGKEIGSSTSAETWQHFYTSTTQNIDDLLVLFVKVDSEGAVHVIRRAAAGATNDDGETIYFEIAKNYSTSLLNETYAWNIEQGKFYDFCQPAQTRSNYISDSQPENPDCDYTETDNSGSGGGQEEQEDPIPDLDVSDYEFNPKYESKDSYKEEEIISSQKQYFKNFDGNYQGLCYGNYDWSKIQPGSILRIYTYKVDSRYNLQIFHGNWGNPLFNITNPTETYDPGNGKTVESIIEITLTQDLLNTIINNNNGICLQGKCCILLGITIQQPEVELPSGNYLFQGRQPISWQSFTPLSSSSYDWSKVPEGAKLTIEFDYTDANNCQVYIRNGNNGSITGIPDTIANWSNSEYMTSKSYSCILSSSQIEEIKNNGGLILGGGGYFLTKLELIVE